jgi:tripartite-type tricarboxylate transporter receptor subunit TctC
MLPDLLGGRIQVSFDNITILAPHVKNGAVVPLAVTTIKRSPILPNVPTLAESGLAALNGFDTGGWFSMYTAHRTPPATIKKINDEIFAMMERADVRERLLGFGATPLPGTPQDLKKQLAAEVPRWRKVIQDADIKVD